MKTIEKILIAALLLGAVEIAKEYITSECVKIDSYVINTPSGQRQHQEIKRRKCYNETK